MKSPMGTFSCPICGIANPHEHTSDEIAKHHGAIDAKDDIASALKHGASAIRSWVNYWIDNRTPTDIEGSLRDAEIIERYLSRLTLKEIPSYYENSECCECNGRLYGKRTFLIPVGDSEVPHWRIVCEDCAARLAE